MSMQSRPIPVCPLQFGTDVGLVVGGYGIHGHITVQAYGQKAYFRLQAWA